MSEKAQDSYSGKHLVHWIAGFNSPDGRDDASKPCTNTYDFDSAAFVY